MNNNILIIQKFESPRKCNIIPCEWYHDSIYSAIIDYNELSDKETQI